MESEQQLKDLTATERQVNWFLVTFPKFSTKQVSEARNGPMAQDPEKPRLWRSVTRRLSSKTSVHVFLHIDPKFKSFELRNGNQVWPVTEDMLTRAVKTTGKYVGLTIGTDVLRLDTAELLAAFNSLKNLQKYTSQVT